MHLVWGLKCTVSKLFFNFFLLKSLLLYRLTIKLTAKVLHADCCHVVPFNGVKPNESSNHGREENICLCPIGFLVTSEYLVREDKTQSERIR